MKTNHIVVLAALTLLASCKKDIDATAANAISDTIVAEETHDTVAATSKTIKGTYDLKQLIDPFIAEKQRIEQQLTTASPDEANKLYDNYIEANRERIAKISEKEHNILENFYTYFYNEGGEATPPDSIQRKVKLLSSAGLELFEEGEGYVSISNKPDFYYTIFKKYVTSDYKEFIRINADEDKILYSADAGISISFKGISERVLNWENFIAKYPKSKFIPDAINSYRSYQDDYFFGQDNTPAHDDSGNYFDENITEYKRFVAHNPDSFTTKLAKIALAHTGSRDDLRNIISQEQEKFMGK